MYTDTSNAQADPQYEASTLELYNLIQDAMIVGVALTHQGVFITLDDHTKLLFPNCEHIKVIPSKESGGKAISALRDMVYVQGMEDNFSESDYMAGLYNGLELALGIMERRDPIIREPRSWWFKFRRKLYKKYGI